MLYNVEIDGVVGQGHEDDRQRLRADVSFPVAKDVMKLERTPRTQMETRAAPEEPSM
jgi:hypothetical protein